jgi:hypothetical protein
MNKEFKVNKIHNDEYELHTITVATGEKTISVFKRNTVLDIHKNLLANQQRVDQNISAKVKELAQFEDIERELGEKFTNEEVVRFAQLGALADSRGKMSGVQGQLEEAKEIRSQIFQQIKQIEAAIPELMR